MFAYFPRSEPIYLRGHAPEQPKSVGLKYPLEEQKVMNTALKFDSVCSIFEEKIKTSLVSLSLIMKKKKALYMQKFPTAKAFHFFAVFTVFKKHNLFNMFEIQKII